MPARRRLDERVGALERRLTDGDSADSEPETVAESDASDLSERIEALESTVAELEAGLQAVRGYVGHVEHVNESVERRADAAIAAVERLESAPKTPPPIATATQEEMTTPAAAETESAEDQSESDTSGLLDRIPSLR